MRSTRLFIGAVLTAGVVLAGCGGGAGDDSAQSTSAAGGAAEPAREAPAAEAPAGKDEPARAPELKVDQRSIIYTGSITVRVDNVTTAAAQATGIATAAGGFVGSDNRHSGDGADNATLELRVPAPKFATVVDQLSKLGTEELRGINTEDVTEQVVDLDARIAVQRARLDSGRRLLAQAKSLEDLVMLEKEVATRESDLASLEAKKRRLADLTALSTISVVLLDPEAERADGDDGPPGFLAGLKGGWDALLASLAVLVTVLGAVLPWLIALGLPAWAIVWAARRFGRRRPGPEPVPAGMPAYAMPPHPGAMAAARPGGVEGHAMPRPGGGAATAPGQGAGTATAPGQGAGENSAPRPGADGGPGTGRGIAEPPGRPDAAPPQSS
jgi:outer membrane murein-binding lipoprotein Lpp